MFKMDSHNPFEHLKHKLRPKEGSIIKLTIWLPTLKVKNRPDFLTCKCRATYHWKTLNEGYNFSSNLISIGGLHAKLWAPKVTGIPTMGISGLPFGSPRTKWHLGAGLVARHKAYYKGEGGGSPKVEAVVSLLNPSLPMVRPNTKSAPIMH